VKRPELDHFCVLSIALGDGYRPKQEHGTDLTGPPENWVLSRAALKRARTSGLSVLSFDTSEDGALRSAGSGKKPEITSVPCAPFDSSSNRGIVCALGARQE
jgi:hypothetical protein